jgi:uncharacterized protein YbbK (DUF523 family)
VNVDVSVQFLKGAEQALERARSKRIRVAILKEGSPSCRTSFTYDGTFTTTQVPNPGVTAALLRQDGVHVFGEAQLADADKLLKQLEVENAA